MSTTTTQFEAIMLKGIASQILQMNLPTISIVNQMLKELDLHITDKEFVYSGEKFKRAIIACLMFSNANNNQGLNKVDGANFGEQCNTIIYAALNSKSYTECLSKFKDITSNT